MTSPLVKPVSGYITLSRFESSTRRPSTLTVWMVRLGMLHAPADPPLLSVLAVPAISSGRGLRLVPGLGEALLQGGEQVDRPCRGLRLRFDHDLLACGLLLDEVEDAVAV